MRELLDEDHKVYGRDPHLRERWKIAGIWLFVVVILANVVLFGAMWAFGDTIGEGWWYPLLTYGVGGLFGVAAAMLVFYASLPRDEEDNRREHGPVAAPFLFSGLAGIVVFFAISMIIDLVLQMLPITA